MNPLIGYGLISGVGSLASGLVNNALSQNMSKDLMDYQYKLQQEAIDKQNLYNSPAEQMKRLAQAQLNPNLVYGSGVDGNQSSAASPSIANRKSELGNPFQDMGQAYLQAKQLELAEIKTRNEAFESRERQLKLRAETMAQLLDNDYNNATMRDRIQQASQKLSNMIADEALTWSQTRNTDNMLEQIWANTALIKSRKHLTDEQALTESVRRESIRKGMELTDAQISQVAAYIDYLEAGTDLRELGYKTQSLIYDVEKLWQQWKKDHPNTTITLEMIKELLGVAGQGAGIAAQFM